MARLRRGAVLAGVLLLAAPLCILADRVEVGVEVEARAMEEDGIARRRPPMPEIGGQVCAQLGTQEKCRMENGCSWCVMGKRSGDRVGSSSVPSSSSLSSSASGKSPLKKKFGDGSSALCSDWHACSSEGQCESRNSSSSCTVGGGVGGGSECIWCSQEERCLPKAASSGQGWGQCTGCDNVFDSGAMIDSCGICGGSCIYISKQEAVGISLALGGNLLISVSLNMQKHAHNLNEASSVTTAALYLPPPLSPPPALSPLLHNLECTLSAHTHSSLYSDAGWEEALHIAPHLADRNGIDGNWRDWQLSRLCIRARDSRCPSRLRVRYQQRHPRSLFPQGDCHHEKPCVDSTLLPLRTRTTPHDTRDRTKTQSFPSQPISCTP